MMPNPSPMPLGALVSVLIMSRTLNGNGMAWHGWVLCVVSGETKKQRRGSVTYTGKQLSNDDSATPMLHVSNYGRRKSILPPRPDMSQFTDATLEDSQAKEWALGKGDDPPIINSQPDQPSLPRPAPTLMVAEARATPHHLRMQYFPSVTNEHLIT